MKIWAIVVVGGALGVAIDVMQRDLSGFVTHVVVVLLGNYIRILEGQTR